MCNCIEENEAKAAKIYEEQNPSAKNVKVEVVGCYTALGFTKLEPIVLVAAKISFDKTLKNGNVKSKEVRTSMQISYCPFCGEKY